jgi:hypothetical protein
VIKDACLNGDSPEFAAIAAVAEHHNIISVEYRSEIAYLECCLGFQVRAALAHKQRKMGLFVDHAMSHIVHEQVCY